MASLDITWGPYRGPIEASAALHRFVDRACGPAAGIAWTANGMLYPIRGPVRDGHGYGNVVVFEWRNGRGPQLRMPPKGFWQRVEDFIKEALAQQGREQLLVGQSQLAMGRAIGQVFSRAFGTDRPDTANVLFDIVAVALPLAAVILTGGVGAAGVIALTGLMGGVIVLGADGTAYGMELSGDDAAAERFKHNHELLRLVATAMTLGDLAKAPMALVEIIDAAELLQKARTTGSVAGRLAAGTANAARAVDFSQIAEKAYLRAQILGKQIRAGWTYEVAPRVAGLGATGLLIREEIVNDESLLNEFVRRFSVHSVAVHR